MNPTTPASPTKKSRLLAAGIVLIAIGLFVPSLVDQIAKSMTPSALRSIAFLATDLFRICFFAGIAISVIGFLRNRKSKQQQTA